MNADTASMTDGLPVAPGRSCRPCRLLAGLSLSIVLAGMVAWSVMAIVWSNLPAGLRPYMAGIFAISSAFWLAWTRLSRRGVLAFCGVFALLVAWWLNIPPSNDRDWQPDVAVSPDAVTEGDKVTIRNIRNCEYRSETDFDVRYYDQTFDVSRLQTVDLYLCYWGSPMIAHTMMSFGFDDDQYVCISIETRKEKGEEYSAIRGFFKQYELIYVVGDERDLVRLRTNYRQEDVYLYRLQADPQIIRKVFLDYMRQVARLHRRAEWYNALTDNCTTSIRGHTAPYARRTWWSWKLLLNGYVDEMAYDNGAINHGLPFAETKVRCRINEQAAAADQDQRFSTRIRQGLPGINVPSR